MKGEGEEKKRRDEKVQKHTCKGRRRVKLCEVKKVKR
jgi:hypothetical protein